MIIQFPFLFRWNFLHTHLSLSHTHKHTHTLSLSLSLWARTLPSFFSRTTLNLNRIGCESKSRDRERGYYSCRAQIVEDLWCVKRCVFGVGLFWERQRRKRLSYGWWFVERSAFFGFEEVPVGSAIAIRWAGFWAFFFWSGCLVAEKMGEKFSVMGIWSLGSWLFVMWVMEMVKFLWGWCGYIA